MSQASQFRALDVAVARLSATGAGPSLPEPPDNLDEPEAMRAFLREVAEHPVAREAIAVSSAGLDAGLDRVASGGVVSPARLRRMVFATSRYLSRMAHRATPFGLMAGVAPARFDPESKFRIGAEHRKHVRADMGWLIEVIRPWETHPAVLEGLRLVVNDLCLIRGDRLVLPLVRKETDERAPDDRERTVRLTGAVRGVLAAAERPIPHPELVDLLRGDFPDVPRETVRRMVAQLVEGEFLLTDLRPPATVDDPLGHALKRLPEEAGLAEVRDALTAYARTSPGEGGQAWRAATSVMRRLRAADRLIQVDLAMDADVVLPDAVASEFEQAATVAWRIAPPDLAPFDPLADYRADFVERYGTGALVPIKEVLDPEAGIGPPAGYLLPPGVRRPRDRAAEHAGRDALLLGLAQRGDPEIVLDDELVARLSRPGSADERTSYVEMCAQLLADSADALRTGDFRLVVAPANFTRPGAMFGRFLHLLPELGPAVAAAARDEAAPAVPAQLVGPTVHSRTSNVAQVPRLTEDVLRIGVFADRPGDLGLDDLLVGADRHRFFVVSRHDRRELAPMTFNALNPQLTMPNAARFLMEVGESRTPHWPLWTWGAAERLPYLPRVRRGRTIFASARWLPDPRLRGEEDWAAWRRVFDRWRADWAVPDVVYATSADHRVRLDLTSASHVRLLHADLRKRPGIVLQEEPAGGRHGSGWAGGHATEVVVPLRPVRPRKTELRKTAPRKTVPRKTVLRKTVESVRRPAVRRVHLPGGEWLYLKVYATAGRHGELLSRHLPELVRQAAPVSDRWFFVRYRDEDPHLRLRFHGEPAELNTHLLPIAHRWAADLADANLISGIVIDAYRPEIARYGGPELVEAAERAFHADAESVLEQLTLREQRMLDLPMLLLLAANHVDMAEHLHGDGWRDWLLRAYPKGERHGAFRQHRSEATRLLDPVTGAAELARLPGGPRVLESWRRRAEALAAYGRLARETLDDPSDAFASMLHMHHNRLAGIDPHTERDAYAVARGAVQAHHDRERHLNR
ncbi:lantibiotic dehydratase [Streptosporangium carneum]|uniref:Lantibiotic dehydratase n=1 Tax=Streptosporangium carneum TaxID=47481 RepID=A0A9W6HWD6_9ACTN|nr:lantibiotic dehydratase [Streptosporangium carneum]GLK07590.1 lantibiotic dehydratase [Streptosporangium carneum]